MIRLIENEETFLLASKVNMESENLWSNMKREFVKQGEILKRYRQCSQVEKKCSIIEYN